MRLSAPQKGVASQRLFGGEERGDAHAMHVRGEAFIEREASLVVSRRFSTWGRCCLPQKKLAPAVCGAVTSRGIRALYGTETVSLQDPHLV